ncbi:MAG: hypothetical protein VX899_25335 [Myxococcota bacterium]|nr:hypothetical protein [Myxococcota bacterium]
MRGPAKQAWAWLAGTLAVAGLPGLPVLWGRIWLAHDLRHHTLPWRDWAVRTWAAGELPLWTQQMGLGFPLMADGQTGVFYLPVVLLGLIFAPEHALSLSLWLHTLWAALGAWVLARSTGRSLPAASFAALAFALGGFLVGRLTYAGMQHVAATFPWLIWAALRLHRPSLSRALTFGLFVAMVLTAGHPQLGVIALVGALIAWLSRRLPSPRSAALSGLGAAVGLAAAAPQLAASLELSRYSARAGGVDAAFAGIGSLPPWELINLLLPRFWGWEPPASIPLSYTHKGPAYFGTGETHWDGLILVGGLVLGLALAGLPKSWRSGRLPKLWLGLTLGGLVLMLGRYTPVYGLVHCLPGLSFFRFPVRYALWVSLALPMLGAWALDRVDRAKAARLLGICAAALLVGGLLGRLALPLLEPMLMPRLLPAVGPDRAEALLAGMRFNGSLGLILPVGVAGLGAWALHKGQWRALPGLLAVELIVGLWGYNRLQPVDQALPSPQVLAQLPEGMERIAVVDRVQPTALERDLLPASLSTFYGASEVIVLSPLRMPGHEELLNAAGLDVGMDHGPGKAQDAVARVDLVRLWGVSRLLTIHELGAPYALLTETDLGVKVYETPGAFERAWFVDCAVDSGSLSSLALGSQVLMDQAGGPCVGGQGSVRITALSDRELELEVDAPSAGWVVISQTWYPGWVAWDASAPDTRVPVRRADQTLQAVPVGQGSQVIRMRYQPAWAWTLWVALGAGILLGVHLLSTAIRKGISQIRGRRRTVSVSNGATGMS